MRVMLMTVGTGARVYDAISKSIDEADPDRLYLFGTTESQKTVVEVQARLESERILDAAAVEFVLIDDPNEHVIVFEAVRRVVDDERGRGMRDRNFVVDYTSGTKAMSVGLALGASAYIPGASYRYVGSRMRDSEYGRVLSGEEDIKIRKSPLYYFAFEEERTILEFLRGGFFARASAAAQSVLARNPSTSVRPRIGALACLAEALGAWDDFRYADARMAFMKIEHDQLVNYSIEPAEIRRRAGFLETLCEQAGITGGGAVVPCLELVVDMLGNMRRRLEERRVGDALMRGRRAATMSVQLLLFSRHGIDANALDPDVLTAAAKAALETEEDIRFWGPDGKMRVSFRGGLRLLILLGDDEWISPFRSPAFERAMDETMQSMVGYGFRPSESEPHIAVIESGVTAVLERFARHVRPALTLGEMASAVQFPVPQ